MIDLLIKNGKTINNKRIEIAINSGKIVEVSTNIEVKSTKLIDLENKYYISAGWIDAHVHAYESMELYYDYPDKIGLESGVTTVIDAGTTGAENIEDFYNISRNAKTNVYALINISKYGIVEQDELADLNKVDYGKLSKKVNELPEFIVGLKARMSNTVIGNNGIKPLKMAKELQRELNNIPLMVHVGSAPPELNEILEVLNSGDIVTHCFNGKQNGILDREKGAIKTFAKEAQRNGIIYDIGHGSASFDFKVAERAFQEGIMADSISTDIYSKNRMDGPVYSMATTLEKMKIVGYSWEEIISKITNVPADFFNLSDKGRLEVGKDADITIFEIKKEAKVLIDSSNNIRKTKEVICPIKTIIGGIVHDNNI